MPVSTASNIPANIPLSIRLTSSMYRMFPSALDRRPGCSTALPDLMASSMSMPPYSCSSVTFRGQLMILLSVIPAAALASVVLAEPLPPLSNTVLMLGLIRAHSNARLPSSIPTMAVNGKLKGPADISPVPLCPILPLRTDVS